MGNRGDNFSGQIGNYHNKDSMATTMISKDGDKKAKKNSDHKLSELTTRRVIMLVLGIMFTVPVFTISTYRDESIMFDFGLSILASYDK
jgi:hypothetical protein